MEEKLKKISQKLRESEIRYRRLFETAHDGILILNSETGQITDVNPFLIKLLGYSKSQFLNKKLWEVGAFKNIAAAKDAFEVLQNQGFLRYENLPLETKSGRLVEVEFVANSYIAGSTLVIQCNIRDITERKNFDLAKNASGLLEEEKLKVGSIAESNHELRTPLAVIKGNVDLAMLNVKSPMSAIKAIDHEIKHLSSIISTMALLTSDGGKFKNKINHNKLNLYEFINKVIKRLKNINPQKNITISVKIKKDINIVGDKIYLEKLVSNLVRNAITYGKENGWIKVSVEKKENLVEIRVADNGIGIGPEDLPHIFKRFYRADKSHSSDGKRTGLGLAIAKWVVNVHGGEISVTSKLGKGSVFLVILPLKPS